MQKQVPCKRLYVHAFKDAIMAMKRGPPRQWALPMYRSYRLLPHTNTHAEIHAHRLIAAASAPPPPTHTPPSAHLFAALPIRLALALCSHVHFHHLKRPLRALLYRLDGPQPVGGEAQQVGEPPQLALLA